MHSFSEKVRFIESIFGKGHLGRTGNLEVRCPICAPVDTSKKKLSIKVEKDYVHCWVCGWSSRSLSFLIKKYGTAQDLARYLDEFAVDKTQIIVQDDKTEAAAVCLPNDFTLLVEAPKVAFKANLMKSYLRSRCVLEDDWWYFKLGYSEEFRWQDRVLIPSFDALGKLNYFTGRSIHSKASLRYDNPYVIRTDIIFNELNIDWQSELVLCEGPFDLMKCPQNSTCLLGSGLNENYALFQKIVVNETPIVLLLDSDAKAKAARIARLLTSYGIKTRIATVNSDTDAGSLDKVTVQRLVIDAVHFIELDSLFSRLEDRFKLSLKL